MTLRRLLSALLVPVVLATGLAAAVHAHLPKLESRSGLSADATFHIHDAGCPVCRLAHDSTQAALPSVSFAHEVASYTTGDAADPVPLASVVDLARSPRAPPVPLA